MRPAKNPRFELACELARRFDPAMPAASRRRFISSAARTLAGLALAPSLLARPSGVRPRFASDPFTLGVASGYPTENGAVIWTRLACEPLNGGGISDERVQVGYELASDRNFKRIVRQGEVRATLNLAHSVHVEVDQLEPGHEYFYRFMAGDAVSAVGRFHTAPSQLRATRFAVASCQHFEQGYFQAYRQMVADDPQLIVFVGDYLYEVSWGDQLVRRHVGDKCMNLVEFRRRHAQYKMDPDLQAAHAACAWLLTWDDHEVENDYADELSETLNPQFLMLRADGYQAYYEHMPLPRRMLPRNASMRIYGTHRYGPQTSFHILDTRQYRAPQACPPQNFHGSQLVGVECTERLAHGRALLGTEQESWLEQAMTTSKANWNVLVQPTLFAPQQQSLNGGPAWHSDGWDGYPHARQWVIDLIARSRLSNPLIVGGDVHAHYVAQVHAEPENPKSTLVASEFCGTSISAQGLPADVVSDMVKNNPHILLGRSDTRGYQIHQVDEKRTRVKLVHTLDVKEPLTGSQTLAQFEVRAGSPRINRL